MEIKDWLQQPDDYAKGVELYKKTKGHNKLLLRQFCLRETHLRKEKLIYELKKFCSENTSVEPDLISEDASLVTSVLLRTVETEAKKTAPLFHQLPKELRPVLLKANNLFRENCLLKVELNETADEDEVKALEIQRKIDRNFKANAMCWDKIEYWKKHKILPSIKVDKPIQDFSMDQLIKQQQLLNSSVSRMEKRLRQNKASLDVEQDADTISKIVRKISKQEAAILKKRDELLTIKNSIDVKVTGI